MATDSAASSSARVGLSAGGEAIELIMRFGATQDRRSPNARSRTTKSAALRRPEIGELGLRLRR